MDIFIVGNGFDLACGLKTTYIDFFKSSEYNPKKYKFIGKYLDSSEIDETWVDFEQTIGNLLKDIHQLKIEYPSGITRGFAVESKFYELILYLSNEFPKPEVRLDPKPNSQIAYKTSKYIFDFQSEFYKEKVGSYNSVLSFSKVKKVLDEEFKQIKIDLFKYLREASNWESAKPSKFLKNEFEGISEAIIINFNYNNNFKMMLEEINSDLNDLEEINIHGQHANNSEILGINSNDKSLKSYFPNYIKETLSFKNEVANIKNKVLEILNKKEKDKIDLNVHIVGHSLNNYDLNYFAFLFEKEFIEKEIISEGCYGYSPDRPIKETRIIEWLFIKYNIYFYNEVDKVEKIQKLHNMNSVWFEELYQKNIIFRDFKQI